MESSVVSDIVNLDLTGINLLAVLDQIKTLVPIILPAVVGFLAFRKGWSFIKSAIMGA